MKSTVTIAVLTLLIFGMVNIVNAEDQSLPKRIFLNKNSINPEEQTRVMLYTSKFSIYPQLNQPAMFIQMPVSGDPLASLVGAIVAVTFINESNKSNRDSAINFNNDLNLALLSSININDELKLALQTELSKNESFKKLEFEEVGHINELSQAGLLTRIEEKSTLTLATRVHFDAQLKSLCFESSAKIWRKNEAKPIYFTDLSYSSANLTESNKVDLKQKWVSNNGELLISKIREGIAEIAHMLAIDLSKEHELEADALHPTSIKAINTTTSKEMQTTLYIVEELPNRLIGRLGTPDSSLLTSIPKTNLSVQATQ
jgi:hypothetical protein